MSYPGNSSLSPEIQKRILGTFQQTLTLAGGGGRREEALLGCDFILRLDPLFEPARQLQKALESADGAVSLEEFAEFLGGGTAAQEMTEELFAEALSEAGPEEQAAAEAPSPGPPASAAAEPEAPEVPTFVELDDLDLGLEESEESEEPALGTVESAPEEAPLLTIPDAVEGELAGMDEPDESEAAAPAPDAAPPEDGVPGPLDTPELKLETEPAARLDSESEQRVDELLEEGQTAFDDGEYQSAIDAWSRIFLIDIDHPEANRRIELARKLKAEVERKVEEAFHEGLSLLEGGDQEAAEKAFERVLEMQPHHLAAQEHLEKIQSGDYAGRPPTAPVETAAEPSAAAAAEAPTEQRGTAAAAPAAPRMIQVARAPKTRVARPAAEGRRRFLLIGSGVLVLVVAGGWLLLSNWSRMFPNSAPEPAAPTATEQPDPVARAEKLHEEGRTPMAISQLRRLPPDSPQFEEAQALIAQWEAALGADAPAASGPTAEDLAQRDALLEEARQANRRREFLLTSELLGEAAKIAPLGADEAQLRAEVDQQLAGLDKQITLFRQGDWEFALRELWLLHESDPRNRDVTRLMVDSYFNLGLRDLQRSDPEAAAAKFAEGLELAPDDGELRRLARFAETYQKRPADLLYRIFVKYQPFR